MTTLGFPGYGKFFGTMPSKYWDLLAAIEKKCPLRGFFWRNSQSDEPSPDEKVVDLWLFNAALDKTITVQEFHFLDGMVGTR